jgi:NAD(P)-dependent dehydrogenase (short-subunit alcohol dehydrogenase family)
MDYQLRNLPALVTGASRGIGRATALALAREGARVALAARDAGALESLGREIAHARGVAAPLPGDLSQPGAAFELLARTREALGADPAILVLCHASFTPMAKVHSLDAAAVRSALSLDLEVSLDLLRAVVPPMMGERFGRIVIVSSLAASLGQSKAPLGCAIKGALEGLARNLAVDFTRFGITTNVVAPGYVETERLAARVGSDQAARDRLRATTAARALARPEEVAEVCVFLCSHAASYLSGAVIPVSGGSHLANHG